MVEKELLDYRLAKMIYSQNMFTAWKRDRNEFIDKYIKHIFWSDDGQLDREYEKNMSYGRDYHLMCQRIFLGIEPIRSKNVGDRGLDKIINIYNTYKDRYNDRLEFKPEYTIELKDRIQVTYDLIVEIYDDSGNLLKVDIWDWKTEARKIEKKHAENRIQTQLYMYVCKESIASNVEYENIRMYYYQPFKDNLILINYSKDKHIDNKTKIYTMIDEIRNINMSDITGET
nr:PD-(D/E)XK nuclease family protein [uncultured Peptostreptococcus sp.]